MTTKMARILLPACFFCLQGWSQQTSPGAGSNTPSVSSAEKVPRPPWITQVGLNHYAESNHKLSAEPAPARVVLMGDSITEFWKGRDPALFTDDGYVDRGISAQTTLQILLRFRQDVVELRPAAVVILAGINDLAQNVGPESVEMIEGNLQSMAEIAEASKIAVVFCALLPTDHFPWRPELAPFKDVQRINAWMKQYATDHQLGFVDYFTAMSGSDGSMPKTYSNDDVHPTEAGYAVMRPLMIKGVSETLERTHSKTKVTKRPRAAEAPGHSNPD